MTFSENQTQAQLFAKDVFFTYRSFDEEILALENISLSVKEGSHVAILGANGSGKSTLAKLFNALEFSEKGEIWVAGLKPESEEKVLQIRKVCGMVFQNPDNQIIGTTVEEEIAFGPENLGISSERIRKRVDLVAGMVGLKNHLKKSPHSLSGGQKQKLAIAGVLAMQPRIIVLDESTSMLDPMTRREFMELCEQLRKAHRLTFINITHHMEEVLLADEVYVMGKGRILLHGTPAQIFEKVDLLQSLHLDLPVHTKTLAFFAKSLHFLLQKNFLPQKATAAKERYKKWEEKISALLVKGESDFSKAVEEILFLYQEYKFFIQENDLDFSTYLQEIEAFLEKESSLVSLLDKERKKRAEQAQKGESLLRVENLHYVYEALDDSPAKALKGVSFEMKAGEILGIMGETGSGKSTLMQHLNGLLRPQGEGQVLVLGKNTREKKHLLDIRQEVALLFQYPEHQLFAETVEKDIAFGLHKLKLSEEEKRQRVKEALLAVGLDESFCKRSPFELSGGQKRRVALAGLLVMKPKILVLDEPAAGLDPEGRNEVLALVLSLNRQGVSILMVSHSMEDLARVSDRILVLKKGRLLLQGESKKVFQNKEILKEARLESPAAQTLCAALLEKDASLPLQEILDVKNLVLTLLCNISNKRVPLSDSLSPKNSGIFSDSLDKREKEEKA